MDSQEDKNVMKAFNGVKIFSATMAKGRDALGEQVTAWLSSVPDREVVDTVVTQSSDAAFHCLAITIFYQDPVPSWTDPDASASPRSPSSTPVKRR